MSRISTLSSFEFLFMKLAPHFHASSSRAASLDCIISGMYGSRARMQLSSLKPAISSFCVLLL